MTNSDDMIALDVGGLLFTHTLFEYKERDRIAQACLGKDPHRLSQGLEYVGHEIDKQRNQLRLSLESKVENPQSTIENFNRQFQLNPVEKEAVDFALPL